MDFPVYSRHHCNLSCCHDYSLTSLFVTLRPEPLFFSTTSIGSRSPQVDRVEFPSGDRATYRQNISKWNNTWILAVNTGSCQYNKNLSTIQLGFISRNSFSKFDSISENIRRFHWPWRIRFAFRAFCRGFSGLARREITAANSTTCLSFRTNRDYVNLVAW